MKIPRNNYICTVNIKCMQSKETVIYRLRNLAKSILPKDGHVYLYGSRARNEAQCDSDWDILIILNKKKIEQKDYDEISFPITSLGWDLGEMIIPVIYTQEEWNRYSFSPFYKNVEKEKIKIA